MSAKHCYIAHDASEHLTERREDPERPRTSLDPAYGASGVLRVPALTLLTADKFANPIRYGGAGVTAKLSGPGACSTAVEDNLDGTYTVTWSAMLSGMYRVSVLVDGGHVAGSPFAVQVDLPPPGSPRLPPPSAVATMAWSPRSTASARINMSLTASEIYGEDATHEGHPHVAGGPGGPGGPVGRPLTTVTSFGTNALSSPDRAAAPAAAEHPRAWR